MREGTVDRLEEVLACGRTRGWEIGDAGGEGGRVVVQEGGGGIVDREVEAGVWRLG